MCLKINMSFPCFDSIETQYTKHNSWAITFLKRFLFYFISLRICQTIKKYIFLKQQTYTHTVIAKFIPFFLLHPFTYSKSLDLKQKFLFFVLFLFLLLNPLSSSSSSFFLYGNNNNDIIFLHIHNSQWWLINS